MKLIFNGFPVLVQATTDECAACAVAITIAVMFDTDEARRQAIRHQYDLRSLFLNTWAAGKAYFKKHPTTAATYHFEVVED